MPSQGSFYLGKATVTSVPGDLKKTIRNDLCQGTVVFKFYPRSSRAKEGGEPPSSSKAELRIRHHLRRSCCTALLCIDQLSVPPRPHTGGIRPKRSHPPVLLPQRVEVQRVTGLVPWP